MTYLRALNIGLTLSCFVGLGLSIYAYAVGLSLEMDKDYVAMCDISENMSCTKAYKSQYGKGFGLVPKGSFLYQPNSLFGIIFYSFTATLAQCESKFLTQVSGGLIVLSNFASIYFAFILAFILEDFCIVCVGTYIVNFVNLLLIYYKLQTLKSKSKVE